MGLWAVVFVVLMIIWLFGGGFMYYQGPNPNTPMFLGTTLLPWACVAILGAIVLGGLPVR